MRGYLNNGLGYMLTGAGVDIVQVTTTGGGFPLFFSLVDVDNVHPLTGEPAADNTVLSGNLVTLRSREGIYLTAEEPSGGGPLVLMNAYRGNDTARPGRDIYRIYRVDGSPGDPIRSGDRVRFVLAPPIAVPHLGETQWLTTGNPVGRPYLFRETTTPEGSEVFTWVDEALHLADVQLPSAATWPHLSGFVQARMTLSGPDGASQPGGFGVRVRSDQLPLGGSALIRVLPGEVGTHLVEIPLVGHHGERSACIGTVPAAVTAESVVRDEERFVREVAVATEPSAHLALRLVRVVDAAGCLAPLAGILPWRLSRVCFAELVRLPERVGGTPPARDVRVGSPDPRVRNFTLSGDAAALDEPLPLSFDLDPPPPGRDEVCIPLRVDYTEGNRERVALFSLRMRGGQVLLG